MAKEQKVRSGGGSGKRKRGALPVKRMINLAEYDVKPANLKLGFLALLLILAGALAIAKFAVTDRLVAVSRAEGEVATVKREVEEAYRTIDSFGEMTEVYAHYTYSGWTDEEASRADRSEVLRLLRNVILPEAEVNTWNLKGNVLNITMSAPTLEEINLAVQDINADELVDFCTVSNARTIETKHTVKNGDKEETAVETSVTAQIVTYLNRNEGVDKR